jgi:hypothetical protein
MAQYVFPSEKDTKVRIRAGSMRNYVENVIQWANESTLTDKEKEKLILRLAKRRAAAASIEKVAEHPMTIGVFGASQAGKSYLVNELARGAGSRLQIVVGAQGTKDFIRELNPEGGQESTAQVTRFTSIPQTTPDPEFPIPVRLLSVSDLLKIFSNGFAHECAAHEVDIVQFEKSRDTLRSVPDSPDDFLNVYDMYMVENYINRDLGNKNYYFTELRNLLYWEFFREVVSKKSFEVQVEYLSWLWARIDSMTGRFKLLADWTRKLRSEIVWTNVDALVPRENSILDVQNLKGHFRAMSDEAVLIKTGGGKKGPIPRSLLSALTAEVTLQVPSEYAGEFATFCDILDFPGARARGGDYRAEHLDAPCKSEKELDPLVEVFLRGKIAYLFDKYVETRDVNALVLCCPPMNPEALSLPYLVQKWVARTHGSTSADRHDKPVLLYVVFTKFDETLTKKEGGSDPTSPVRWEARLRSGFEEFFAKNGNQTGDNWTIRWDRRCAFQNCYWVRNPNVDQTAFIKQDGAEVIREDYMKWLQELKPNYVQNRYVQAHFSDTDRSWIEVSTPGRHGIQYLQERLGTGLHPDQKSLMLNSDMDSILSDIEKILAAYQVDDDAAEKARKEAELRIRELDEKEYEFPVFGFLLENLCIPEQQIQVLFDESYKWGSPNSLATGVSMDQIGVIRTDMPATEGRARRPALRQRFTSPGPDSGQEDGARAGHGETPTLPAQSMRFSELVLGKWESVLASLENDEKIVVYTGLSADWFRSVTDTVVKGARSQSAAGSSLADSIARISAGAFRSPDPGAHRRAQAFLVWQLLGDYVTNLGGEPYQGLEPPSVTPTATGEGFPGEAFFSYWLELLKRLYQANAGGLGSEDAESAKKLKDLIQNVGNKLW